MQFTDQGLILSVRRFGEHSGIVHVLTEQHGRYAGVARGAFGRKQQAMFQPGNVVSLRWQARLSEQLGSMTCEMVDPVTAHILQDPMKLAALGSACALIDLMLPERDPHPEFYPMVTGWLDALRQAERTDWLMDYVRMELLLLRYAGFGLDLRRCAATGSNEELIYVSPKSARAVSREAGRPYHAQLLPLPPFLVENAPFSGQNRDSIIDGMRLTGYFLQLHIFEQRPQSQPSGRNRLMQMIARLEGTTLGETDLGAELTGH